MTTTLPAVVTRYAPSPSGDQHIGGARTALFCWAFAKKMGGSFLLRIEDTDRARSSEASEQSILKDLAWLGIDWDQGPAFEAVSADGVRTLGGDAYGVAPFRQSERGETYKRYFEQLIEQGLAYPAFDTPEELGAMRKAAEQAKKTFVYRQAEDYDAAASLERMRAGEACVLRFKASGEAVTVPDTVLGDVTFEPGQLDDFVIRKADGMPTYHFACVVDDELMNVTHVLRGQEHLMNTPRHVALQKALRRTDTNEPFRTPVYAHMPLIFNDRGAKMSKRERDQAAKDAWKKAQQKPVVDGLGGETLEKWAKDKKAQLQPAELAMLAEALGIDLPEVSVKDFREAGYLPQTVNNFLALLGWTPSKDADGSEREVFDMDFLAQDFDLGRIGKSNAKFDRKKLLSFSADAVTGMDAQQYLSLFTDWASEFAADVTDGLSADQLVVLVPAVQAQSKTLAETAERCRFAVMAKDEITYDAKAVKKWLMKNEGTGLKVLGLLGEGLVGLADWSAEGVQAFAEGFAERELPGAVAGEDGAVAKVGMGGLAQPLRVALTGSAVSPPIAQTLAVLGKEETLARIEKCLGEVGAGAAS